MVMPSITICTFLTLTNSFKLYDQNLALTAGEPSDKSEMLALNIYNTFYSRNGWEGVGQAKAVIFFLPFALPDEKSFVGIENYISGIEKIDFFSAFGYFLFITIGSVAVIILCTSMCAWYITRVHNKITSGMYYLFAFSMIVPFQMVMFTLSKIADILHLGNPLGIIIVYLGFGAGLAVFMFCGFVKAIPLEIEESAMIFCRIWYSIPGSIRPFPSRYSTSRAATAPLIWAR